GLDGSQTMLEHARRRLARFGGRFRASLIELGDLSWRGRFEGFHAVVSSLAIHHLDDEGKRRLFKDLLAMLSPGGVVIIADLVAPASKRGTALAAEAWDHAVREQSRETGAGEAFAAFERLRWNMYRYPDEDDVDKPSRILDQLKWLEEAGFQRVDVYWTYAGHAIFCGGTRACAGEVRPGAAFVMSPYPWIAVRMATRRCTIQKGMTRRFFRANRMAFCSRGSPVTSPLSSPAARFRMRGTSTSSTTCQATAGQAMRRRRAPPAMPASRPASP